MRMVRRWVMRTVIVACILVAGSLQGYAAVGSEAPNFRVTDFRGQECSLSDYRGKIVVLEWTNPKCPYVQKQYSKETNDGVGNMQAMQKRYTDPSVGVVWVMIASSPADKSSYLSAEEWKAQLEQWGASPTTLIVDASGELAKLYGAQRTPEVMIIGKDGLLLYRGAVDSLRGTDPSEIDQFTNLPWLKKALENAVQNRRVIPPETIPYGCPIR